MKIGVLGTGVVGQTLGAKLVALGHDVMMGGRSATNDKVLAFVEKTGGKAGSFADAAAFGELLIHCTRGDTAIEVLRQAGADNLADKILVDISNPLDFSDGFPPTVVQPDGRSLGEEIQAAFPTTRVVKALNTMNADVMVHPRTLSAPHSVFLAGDDADAKAVVRDLLLGFGWEPGEVVDAGGISAARGLELYLPLWLSLMGSFGTPSFNVAVVRTD